jgi:hypothetical protein
MEVIRQYKQFPFWTKITIWGSIASIVALAIVLLPHRVPVPQSGPIPIIEICYDRRPIYLPYDIEDAIRDLNDRIPLNIESRSLLRKLEKSLTNKDDQYRISFLISITDKLTSIQAFKDGNRPVVFIFQVKNIGTKAAHDLKILFPGRGYVQVYLRGSPTISKEVAGSYIFDSLQPNDEATIYYWTSPIIVGSEDIKASYENGTAKIIKGCP